MDDKWADLIVRLLLMSGWALLIIAALLMTIDSYLIEKYKKSTTRFRIAAGITAGLWFLSIMAVMIFGVVSECFPLAKLEIWGIILISFFIGVAMLLLGIRSVQAHKKDRGIVVFALMSLVGILIGVVGVVVLLTVHPLGLAH